MGIENYNQKYGNKYGGQAQLVSSTDGIIPPIFKSLVQCLEFDAGANLLLRYSYRLQTKMSTNEKLLNNPQKNIYDLNFLAMVFEPTEGMSEVQ